MIKYFHYAVLTQTLFAAITVKFRHQVVLLSLTFSLNEQVV